MLNFRKIAYWVLFILSLFLFCIEKKSFRRLEKPGKDKGIVYVIRQVQPTLAVWSYDFRLEKYKSHFKKKGETQLISRFDLSNGEYFTEELEEGFYLLSIPSKIGVEKIFRIEKGKRIFFRFVIFNEKEISIPDFFIKEITEVEALEDLLENEHLNESFRK
ncbi:hypothetical protein ACO2J1_05825 [Leptospira interrogans]|uniref:Uncharacterized protein n=11 Tax=Leptospira interrogans TaxID=173 RepID=Q8F5X8_LEPIN|nr:MULTISPECIES: hypothetical protein [Leptospira]EMF42481.1 hypothetical protein LEP1GSC067_2928 [Leptospira interrogans serovar Lora str. TE 1992]EMG08623.1 hypothetical protein LEP1GSC151_1623 [Leptospira interrogans serovar Grippotyphosa str. LT2186]EMM96243.1 hypothetical protein LEP1GSC158_2359 [Leptospira interrogans serovar Zanoni str. LT2156]EMN31950.1 hypothetical protein LEP1GSC083_1263 [Leptospira interrogans serovar Pyrogenes str. L0374]EMN69558.1 hypothetical protein LEP1GSC100_3